MTSVTNIALIMFEKIQASKHVVVVEEPLICEFLHYVYIVSGVRREERKQVQHATNPYLSARTLQILKTFFGALFSRL